MFALDLFNNDHERRIAEGAVDQLEQRRIDDLAMKMDDLVARAKTASTAEVKQALMKEFQKCKAERDSYYMVRNETMGYGSLGEETHEFKGAHGKLDVERTPGKTVVTRKEYPDSDEMRADKFPNSRLRGKGTGTSVNSGSGISSGQGSMRKFPRLDHDANDAPKYEVDEAGIGQDIANKTEKMARATPSTPTSKVASTVKNAAKWLAGKGGPGREGPTYESQKKNPKEVDEGRMGEIDAMRQDLERMNDRQFYTAYGISKAAFQQKYRTLLKPALDEHGGGIGPKQHWQDLMQERKLSVGDPVIVTAPNEFEGKTGEIYDFAPSGTFVIVNLYNHGKHSMHLSDVAYNEYADQEQDEEDDWYDEELDESVNPQFIIAQVTKILAGEARRMTNAPMAQLLAPVMKEYNLTLQQIDSMVPGGLRKAASEYGIMMKEGFQDFNKVEPYAVCLAGKPVKKFDYYEQARRFHDNWKQKLYREGNKAKADKITLMPLNLDEATNRHFGPKGAGTELARQIRANGDTNWVNDLSKDQLDALAGPRYPKRPKIQVKKNKGVAEDTGNWIVYDPETKQIKKRFKTHTAGKSYAKTHGLGFASSEFYFDNIKNNKEVAEALTDYQKRRARERDVDAGRPVKALPKNPQTDYARKRAKDRKDMELGEGADLINMSDLQFYKELLGVMVIPVAAFGAMAWNKAMNAIKLYRAEDVVTALQKKGVTVDRSTLEQIKPLLLKLEQAIDVDKDGDVAKELAKRIQQTVTWGKLKQVKPDTTVNRKPEMVEEQDTSGVESAILRRIMTAHTDLLMKFGPEKVMQAAEEVAYNVGDVDEIGTSDVSAYVHQVKQILGVPEELDEKWSQKYKSSINCANPKGFSQRAHCAGKKKK